MTEQPNEQSRLQDPLSTRDHSGYCVPDLLEFLKPGYSDRVQWALAREC